MYEMVLKSVIWLIIMCTVTEISGISRCTYPRIRNGRVRLRNNGHLARFSCSLRYHIVGNKYATCAYGRWDVPFPVCVRPGCAVPEVEHALSIKNEFDSWILYFCMPGYSLVGSSVIYCDGIRWNSTAPSCVGNSTMPKTSCDFDTDLCGWTQDELHDFDWRKWTGRTPSSFLETGPPHDHTHGSGNMGYYMYIESTSRLENDSARLLSPVYDASLTRQGCFSFFYHMYGGSIGGLRVYQKPDSVDIRTLVNSTEHEKSKYLLFDKWGNQGNFWYGSVTPLVVLHEGFQIVIEGIRGVSYSSDIAIDDVSLLQGDNCTAASNAAVTPPTFFPETCVDRCDLMGTELVVHGGCGCTFACLADDNCCPDFYDLCAFEINGSVTDDTPVNRTVAERAPQTEKLLGFTTSSSERTTITTKIVQTTTTIPPTTKLTSTTTTSTTRRPTTKLITKPVTRTTKILIPVKTTVPTTRATKLTTKTVPTTKTSTAPIRRTVATKATPRVWLNATEKPNKKELPPKSNTTSVLTKNIKDALGNHKPVADSRGSSKGLTVAITVITLAVCSALVWVAIGFRGARGRMIWARIRGYTTNDPEVRYLTSEAEY